jgi:hypothetical protein
LFFFFFTLAAGVLQFWWVGWVSTSKVEWIFLKGFPCSEARIMIKMVEGKLEKYK